jgi:hypothetical protein
MPNRAPAPNGFSSLQSPNFNISPITMKFWNAEKPMTKYDTAKEMAQAWGRGVISKLPANGRGKKAAEHPTAAVGPTKLRQQKRNHQQAMKFTQVLNWALKRRSKLLRESGEQLQRILALDRPPGRRVPAIEALKGRDDRLHVLDRIAVA